MAAGFLAPYPVKRSRGDGERGLPAAGKALRGRVIHSKARNGNLRRRWHRLPLCPGLTHSLRHMELRKPDNSIPPRRYHGRGGLRSRK